MGLMYSILMDAIVITGAKDFISVTMPADVCAILHELNITQEASETSDTGAIEIALASGVAGAGTATTPRALMEQNTLAFGGTVLTNLTTDETKGNILMRRGWNVLTPFKWLPTPRGQIEIGGQSIFVVHSDVAITSATVTAELILERIG